MFVNPMTVMQFDIHESTTHVLFVRNLGLFLDKDLMLTIPSDTNYGRQHLAGLVAHPDTQFVVVTVS